MHNYHSNLFSFQTSAIGKRWQRLSACHRRITEDVKPHYFGTLPKVLEETFPNEGDGILEYRKKVYQPLTKTLWWKAIRDMTRAFGASKYAIELSTFAEDYNNIKVNKQPLVSWILSEVYSIRVLDPNALLLVNISPIDAALDDRSQKLTPQYRIIASSRIIEHSDKVLIYAATEEEQAKGVLRWVVTANGYGYDAQDQDRKEYRKEYYQHEIGEIPATPLGGCAISELIESGEIVSYYESDFAPALPFLNKVVVYDNQFASIFFTHIFPILITDEVDCPTCHGVGRYEIEEKSHACGSCNGSGKVIRSPLKGIVRKPTTGITTDEKVARIQNDPIKVVDVSTESASFSYLVFNDAYSKAKEALNIFARSTHAQSAASKDVDDTSIRASIIKISDYMFSTLIQNTLNYSAKLLIMDAPIITVIAPSEIDLKPSEADSFTDIYTVPLPLRPQEYKNYIDRKYSTSPIEKQKAAIVVKYAPLMLLTDEELNAGLAANIYSKEDAIKAKFVGAWLSQLDIDLFDTPYPTIEIRLNELLGEKMKTAEQQAIPIL